MKHLPICRPHFFFTTTPTPCPYLPGRVERKIVTELVGADASHFHDSLSRSGFRRSHFIAYAPACHSCNACVPVRVVAKDFVRSRSQRRTWNANNDLTAHIVAAKATAEQYRLFNEYEERRHAGSDMALMGFYDYRAMIEESPIETNILEFRTPDGTLVAACLMDWMDDGLSAVYSFFAEGKGRRGLGTHVVLWMIDEAQRRSLPYVYLGYWVVGSPKMSYKIKFRPLEGFSSAGWALVTSPPSET